MLTDLQVPQNYEGLLSFARNVAATVARRLPRHIESQDLLGAAYLGLADAIQKHSKLATTDFESLARCRIRGAIRDELRKHDPVPRRVRKQMHALRREQALIATKLGREARVSELAASTGYSASLVHELREQQSATHVSIEGAAEPGPALQLKGRESLAPDVQVQRKEQSERVLAAMPLLTAREQLVLRRIYVDGKMLREVALELGVSEPRVSQIHSAALAKLRKEAGAGA